MKSIRILLILLLITSQSALAFNQKVDTIVVCHDSCQVLQIIVTIDNSDSEALWIWYDRNGYGQDYRKAIRHYLMKRNGDFSIFDIGTDHNMFGEWWHPYGAKDFSLNLPTVIEFADGKTIKYMYSADGHKLKAVYTTTTPATSMTVDYCGNLIFENGLLKQMLVDGGYIPMDDWSGTYRFYVKDHLGNNRMVVHQSGTIEQV